MALSGHVCDGSFAACLAESLGHSVEAAGGLAGHLRPTADLGLPFGKVTGDFGCLLRTGKDSVRTLLIVEREGSAPGNERNILKWTHVLETRCQIHLSGKTGSVPCHFDRLLLLLAFGRPPTWGTSDFEKTVAFCEVLAGIMNKQHGVSNSDVDLQVMIEKSKKPVDDWGDFGNEIAVKLLDRLASAFP